jgi:hypothetical protein
MAAFWCRVVFETVLILDALGIAAAVGLWVSRPWWEKVFPPWVAAAETWAPMRLGDTGRMCWRPVEWTLRHGRTATGADLWQWDAGPGGRLVIIVEPWQPTKDETVLGSLLNPTLQALARWPGFVASPIGLVATSVLRGEFATFGYWRFGGLRPIGWCGWVFRARDGDLLWTACATAPREGWDAFSASAWAVLASLRPLSTTTDAAHIAPPASH